MNANQDTRKVACEMGSSDVMIHVLDANALYAILDDDPRFLAAADCDALTAEGPRG